MEYVDGLKQISFDSVLQRIQVKKTTAPHERADLINQFIEGINRGINAPFKEVTFRQINGQLRRYANHDLYVLLKECEHAKNFGAFFWWKIKNRA